MAELPVRKVTKLQDHLEGDDKLSSASHPGHPGPRLANVESSADGSSARPAHERTPIISEARSPSYHSTDRDDDGGPQASGAQSTAARAAANPRQRRKGNNVDSAVSAADSLHHDGDQQDEQGEGWFCRTLNKYGAIELDNKGSTARDHLALERTFLAWLRTSLSFAGIGIAVTQLFRLNSSVKDASGNLPPPDAPAIRLRRVGKPLGATFLAIAVLVLLIGWRRYFEAQFYITKGKFPASRGSIFLTALGAFGLVVATFVIVLVVDPSLFEQK